MKLLPDIVTAISGINYLLLKGDEKVLPFIKLVVKFVVDIGKFANELSDMIDYPINLLKGLSSLGLIIALILDIIMNKGNSSIQILLALIALVRL